MRSQPEAVRSLLTWPKHVSAANICHPLRGNGTDANAGRSSRCFCSVLLARLAGLGTGAGTSSAGPLFHLELCSEHMKTTELERFHGPT